MTFHRQRNHKVTVFFGQAADTEAFGTDNHTDFAFHVSLTPGLTVHIGTEDPEALFFQFVDTADDVATRTTGIYSTAPAEVFATVAVRPTPRRFGMMTP